MDERISRKQFLKSTLGVAGAGALIGALASCGKGNSPSNTACANGAVNGTITGNHGHTLMVPVEDIRAAAQKTYSIQGTSTHNHTVTITPDQFAQLGQNQTFSVMSTTDSAHSHSVTVQCA
jgi:hypothetical protein